MLLKVKALLEERGAMSLRDLAIHFHTDPQTLEPILEKLIHHGTIRRIDPRETGRCASCPGCSHPEDETKCWYEFVRPA